MSVQVSNKFCKVCGKNVKITRNGRNHILHLLLTLITAGLWLLVWIPLLLTSEPWRCNECGNKV